MSFCRITGKSRGLPRPNYFPVLPPISPADARRFCRITGKAYGLPKHHYIPVLIGFVSRRRKAKQAAGHSSSKSKAIKKLAEEELKNGRNCREHEILPGYKYVFPVLDESVELFKLIDVVENEQKILSEVKQDDQGINANKEVERGKENADSSDSLKNNDQKSNHDQQSLYVYPIDQKQYGLVLPEALEMAVRDGQVSDLLLAKNSDTLLLKLKKGRRISVGLQDFVNSNDLLLLEGEGPCDKVLDETIKAKKRERKKGLDYAKKIFEDKEKTADIEIEQEICEKKPKLVNREKKKVSKKLEIGELNFIEEVKSPAKSPVLYQTCTNFKSRSCLGLMGDWRDLQKPLIENFDWDDIEKSITNRDSMMDSNVSEIMNTVTSNNFIVPVPLKVESISHVIPNTCQFDSNTLDKCSGFEPIILLDDLQPIQSVPNEGTSESIRKLNSSLKIAQSDSSKELSESSNNDIKSTFGGIESSLVCANEISNVVQDISKGEIITMKNIHGLTLDIDGSKKFLPGQTIDKEFVPGTNVMTPIGEQFIPGIVLNTAEGPEIVSGRIVEGPEGPFFAAGQMAEKEDGESSFIYGQTFKDDKGNSRFVEGQTVYTESGPKFIAGSIATDGKFISGQTLNNKFVPGQTVCIEGIGEAFIPGRNIKIENSIEFIPGQYTCDETFIPGKSVLKSDSNSYEFIAGQYVESTNGITGALETKFVPGISRENGDGVLEFLPGYQYGSKFIEGRVIDKIFVPGKTIQKSSEAGNCSFEPAYKINDLVIHNDLNLDIDAVDPVNFSFVENPEKSISNLKEKLCKNFGVEGTKFSADMVTDGQIAPGRIILTEQGWRFVPGQTIQTSDGPRFIPGHVIETAAGPTFIPGQIFYTEEKGNL